MYLIQLLYQIEIPNSVSEQSFEVSSLIINTDNYENAYQSALSHGNNQNCTFINHSSDTVNWKFLGIIELMEISQEGSLQQFDSTLVINPSEYKFDKWKNKINNFASKF